MKRVVHIVLTAALLAGCGGSSPPVPADNFYRILISGPEARSTGMALSGVVSVTAFDADGLVRARPVLFTPSGESHAVRQHNYHFWADSPTKLLQEQLVGYLKKTGLAETVVTPELRVRADFELMGKIKRLERLVGDGAPRVIAELELSLVRLADRRLVVTNTYAVELPADGDSVSASVLALTEAVGRIFAAFAADIDRFRRSTSG